MGEDGKLGALESIDDHSKCPMFHGSDWFLSKVFLGEFTSVVEEDKLIFIELVLVELFDEKEVHFIQILNKTRFRKFIFDEWNGE